MNERRAHVLTSYLYALALLQQNDVIIVKREIRKVIEEIEKELKIES